MRGARAAAMLGTLALLLSCGDGGDDHTGVSAPDAPSRPPNVVLVLLDTFRADRVGRIHLGTSMTPRLDALAAESVVFERAFSHAPWTLPSVASIFTSRAPGDHGAGGRLGSFTMLGPEAVTLAETLAAAGIRTHAITNVLFMGPRFGTMQGFESVDFVAPKDNRLQRIAEVTTASAIDWIDRHSMSPSTADRPFFLVVHYFDAHLTYDPPAPWRARFAAPEDAAPGAHVFGRVSEMVAFRRGERVLDDATIDRLAKLYDGEVAYLDEHVGALVDGLAERGRLDDTLLVVTSDHGEELGDHGGFEHGHTLYDELLHVPLMVRPPGGARPPHRVDGIVRLVDLAPTILDVSGVAVPTAFVGESLAPQLAGEAVPDRPVVSTGNMWGEAGRALHWDGFKLIEHPGGGAPQLFDLSADPGEQRDLGGAQPDRVASMRARLSGLDGSAGGAASPELSDAEREQLRALGYGQ